VSLSARALSDLIGGAYDAAAHPQLWDQFLAQFAGALGARVTFFHQHHFARRTSEVLSIHGMPDVFRREYHEYYSRLNIWRDRGRHLFCEGRVVLDQQICPRSTFERSEFYNDYLLRLGSVHSLTGVIARAGDESVHVTALHDPAQGPWHETDRASIAVLLPHLKRARDIQGRLHLLEAAQTSNGHGAIAFLTGDGHCILANACAEGIFRNGDGLTVRNSVVRALDPCADARLRSVMRDATSAPHPIECSGAVLVPRPSGRRPYQVVIEPLRQSLPLFAGMQKPAILLSIDDPDARQPVGEAMLIDLYRLTPREAALAAAVGAGVSLDDAADRLGMRYETARTHLRRIFDKTSTRRQSELVVLLSGLPRGTARE